MAWFKTLPALLVIAPVLCGAGGQSHAGPAANRVPQTAKVRDRNWLKSQMRRRYGTSALPEKTYPAPGDKKNPPNKPTPTVPKV